MKHLVEQIYNFFKQNIELEKKVTLYDFLKTIPGFEIQTPGSSSMVSMNMDIANNISSLCKKMASQDMLLIPIKTNPTIFLSDEYLSIGEVNCTDPIEFIRDLNYGTYDFKYQGFVYTRSWFKHSVLPISGINAKGDEDMGTAYYIGDNMFVTAAHCINGLERFNLLLNDTIPIKLREVWFAAGEDSNDYDLAIIMADETIKVPAFMLDKPSVLDPVLTIGYPLIPGMFPIQTSETASVGAYIRSDQKAAVGQVVTPVKSYLSKLDFFIINARVKGGNSGGPVINESGKVIGTVVQIPFDNQGGSDGGRYDIMGYGVCLPSEYIKILINNHDTKSMVGKDGYYSIKHG